MNIIGKTNDGELIVTISSAEYDEIVIDLLNRGAWKERHDKILAEMRPYADIISLRTWNAVMRAVLHDTRDNLTTKEKLHSIVDGEYKAPGVGWVGIAELRGAFELLDE